MDFSQIILLVAAGLHLLFVVGEMLPWNCPLILRGVMKKKKVSFDNEQLTLTATIVRNAGIYNAILTAGFVWSTFPGALGLPPDDAVAIRAIRCFFLGGAVVAGLFGLTLSRATALQAIVGGLGLVAVNYPLG